MPACRVHDKTRIRAGSLTGLTHSSSVSDTSAINQVFQVSNIKTWSLKLVTYQSISKASTASFCVFVPSTILSSRRRHAAFDRVPFTVPAILQPLSFSRFLPSPFLSLTFSLLLGRLQLSSNLRENLRQKNNFTGVDQCTCFSQLAG